MNNIWIFSYSDDKYCWSTRMYGRIIISSAPWFFVAKLLMYSFVYNKYFKYTNNSLKSFFLGFRWPKEKKSNLYTITVRPSICLSVNSWSWASFSETCTSIKVYLYQILRSTVPWSCKNINILSQCNQKIEPFMQ